MAPYMEEPAFAAGSDRPSIKLKPRRLILCFDGTGNSFQGGTSDTNVVKLYDKFNRDDDFQYHYYQPGIGTYDIGGGSLNKSFWGSIQSKISRTLDQGFGTSFDAHIIAGYRFVMEHYNKGDKIYLFGFSRGAFQARFLARMINTVGLLSKGNGELIPFAYSLFQEYEQGKFENQNSGESAKQEHTHAKANTLINIDPVDDASSTEDATPSCDEPDCANKIEAFSATFCRREVVENPVAGGHQYEGVKIYFLGLWDCVNSVAVLDSRRDRPVSVAGTAVHVRHAVAINERRVKFKPTLFAHDMDEHTVQTKTWKEVWFPGNHGDVGGGWMAGDNANLSWWGRLKSIMWGSSASGVSTNVVKDDYQLSDVPLAWMINELEEVGKLNKDYAVSFNKKKLRVFQNGLKLKKAKALASRVHDVMRFGGGTGIWKVFMWNLQEWIPFMSRYELNKDGKWYREHLRFNMGSYRDMPKNACVHESLKQRMLMDASFNPLNNHGDGTKACLAGAGKNEEAWRQTFKRVEKDENRDDHGFEHNIYTFREVAEADEV